MENLKKREPILALLLSFVTPGLGQIYNGQFRKGIILYLTGLLIITILSFTGLFLKFYGMIFCIPIIIGFWLFILLEALYSAKRLKKIKLKRYNKWYFYCIIFLINTFVISPLFNSIIKDTKTYKIPSSAMEPTLQVGDHLTANMKIYKNEKPKRGDVIIFKYPIDPSKDFIKRVIGLEGEKVEIIHNKIYINHKLIDDPWGHYDERSQSAKYLQPMEKFGPVIVPKGSLFVLGDNRDNSQDSRHWGYVNVNAIKGKAIYIYFSWDRYARNILGKIRWNRFCKLIN